MRGPCSLEAEACKSYRLTRQRDKKIKLSDAVVAQSGLWPRVARQGRCRGTAALQ